MSFEVFYDEPASCFRMTLTNPISVDELVSGYEQVLQHPSFLPAIPSVWDLRQLELGKIPLNDIRALPRKLGPLVAGRLADYPVALVTDKVMELQLLRVYLGILKLIGSNLRMRLFSSMDEALRWIDQVNTH